jgi:hypothetical protein
MDAFVVQQADQDNNVVGGVNKAPGAEEAKIAEAGDGGEVEVEQGGSQPELVRHSDEADRHGTHPQYLTLEDERDALCKFIYRRYITVTHTSLTAQILNPSIHSGPVLQGLGDTLGW